MPRVGGSGGREESISKELRVNEKIRAREVRLVGEDGKQIGIVSLREALEIARQRGLDLVEVAPTAQPPVCKLMDYGKYRYEQTKKEREARKSQKVISIKEIRLRPKIDEHDFQTKLKAAERFLMEGNKVKLTVLFRGREQAHAELGQELLDRMVAELASVAQVEQASKAEGRTLAMVLAPSKSARKATPKAPARTVAP